MRSTPLSGYPDYNASNRNSQESWLESVRTVRNDQKQEEEFGRLLPLASENGSDAYSERFQEILVEMKVLKDKRGQLEEMLGGNAEDNRKIVMAKQALAQTSSELTEWSEPLIRQLVETVRVLSADEIEVTLSGGVVRRQKIERR